MNEINLTLKSHFNSSNKKLEEATSEYSRDKLLWESEKQEFLIKVKELQHSLDETKAKLFKIESEKASFVENLKLQVARHIDERFKEKIKI
jgi:hypothetical protein